MNVNLKKLEQLDRLIASNATGSPVELALKLGISQPTLYRYINTMKRFGAPIEYDPISISYIYKVKGKFHFRFCPVTPDCFFLK